MAEVEPTPRMGPWSRLKKKIGDARRNSKRKTKGKTNNPYAAQGLEKFAGMVAELQAKKASLVDKTGNSVSAALYLSRSAQEWTAETIARTASQCLEKDFQKASDLLLVQSPSRLNTYSEDLKTAETIDSAESFSFPESRGGDHTGEKYVEFQSEPLIVGDFQREFFSVSGRLADEGREPRGEGYMEEEVGSSGKSTEVESTSLPSMSRKPIKKFVHSKGWKQASDSAMAVLVALGAYIASRMAKFGNPLAAAMTFSIVIRKWHKGKIYSQQVLSAVARYVLTPLHSYLSTHVPRRLAVLPAAPGKAEKEPAMNPETHVANDEFQPQSEIEIEVEHNQSLAISGALTGPIPSLTPRRGVPLSVLLEDSESSSHLAAPSLTSTHLSSASSTESGSMSPTRRFVKKLNTKLKSKLCRTSSSVSDVIAPNTSLPNVLSQQSGLFPAGRVLLGDDTNDYEQSSSRQSPSVSPSRDSSTSGKRKRFTRSWKAKGKAAASEVAGHSESRTEDSLERKSGSPRKCCLRRVKSSEHGDSKYSRRSVLSRSSTQDSLENLPAVEMITTQPAVEVQDKGGDSWPAVGLLISLFFLMVGRLPAILATTLFFLILSQVQKDKSHHRGQGREMATLRRAQEAARKLHRSPPPLSRRPGSPLRGELLLSEYCNRGM